MPHKRDPVILYYALLNIFSQVVFVRLMKTIIMYIMCNTVQFSIA